MLKGAAAAWGAAATFENDRGDAVGDVVREPGRYRFLWGRGTTGELVARTGPSPWDLSGETVLLDGYDSAPKFSAARAGGETRLVVGVHGGDRLEYYSISDDGAERGGVAAGTAQLPARFSTKGFYRSALAHRDGTFSLYATVMDHTVKQKEAVLLRGPSLDELEYVGVALDGSEHRYLNACAEFGSVWWEDGRWRAYVDGGRFQSGVHEAVMRATSIDGLTWNVRSEPELTLRDVPDGSYHDLYVYAPAGAWHDGRFVGLMPGCDTVTGAEGDVYDHDTALVVSDGFGIGPADVDPDRGHAGGGRRPALRRLLSRIRGR